jgi:ABC-type branched-subunit amino acid transport system substrate-binding protein
MQKNILQAQSNRYPRKEMKTINNIYNLAGLSMRFFLAALSLFSWIIISSSNLLAEGLSEQGEIHIAVVGPFSGKTAVKGQSIRRGVQLYIDAFNKHRGKGQKKIALDYYDDQNNPEKAREMAEKIVRDNKAVAVIGHNYSSSSKSGGPIYK